MQLAQTNDKWFTVFIFLTHMMMMMIMRAMGYGANKERAKPLGIPILQTLEISGYFLRKIISKLTCIAILSEDEKNDLL